LAGSIRVFAGGRAAGNWNREEKLKLERTGRIGKVLALAKNDIRQRYANSLFGAVWAYVMPLVTLLVFWVVFQKGFRNAPVEGAPYILWFAAAYVPWVFFADAVTAGCGCLIEYSYLVKKIRFDVGCLPVVKLVSAYFVHAFFLCLLLVMAAAYGRFPGISALWILYYDAAAGALALGLSWLLSAAAVFFKDTVQLLTVAVQIGFWATPVLWDEAALTDEGVRRVLSMNPARYFVNGCRGCLLEGTGPFERPLEAAAFWVFAAVVWIVGRAAFKRLSPFFADEV